MRRKVKSWLLFFLGFCIFMPPFLFTIIIQALNRSFSLYGILFATQFLGWLFIYCFLTYRSVYKRQKTKYPIVPPEGRTDIYHPRTDIPRPIHEDVRRYPEFFKRKKMKKWEKKRKAKG